MLRRQPFFPVTSAGMLATWPTVAAESEAASGHVVTGIVNTGPAIFIFAVAVALLLTLIFRASTTRIAALTTRTLGKRRIRKVLTARSPNVLEDIILPGAYGGLTNIDYAILTSGGILCIRTKHCNGVVFGDADEPQWTHVSGVHRRKFLNPLIQNEGRTRAVQALVPEVPVANVVVFTGRVQFTSPPPGNVIPVRNLESFIAKFVFGPCQIRDWDAVWLTVKAGALTDEDSRKDFQAQLSFS